MDVNSLNTLQPTPPNSGRPQNAARETPRAATGSAVAESDPTQSTAPASFADGGEQPDPSTPRGSLLDITV